MKGWIKLHRKFTGHWLYKTTKPKSYREAWEDILLSVNYENKKVLVKGKLYDCKKGQALLSLESWSKIFNWSRQQVRTFFKLLQDDGMITLEGFKFVTKLTVCNWRRYQSGVTTTQPPKQPTEQPPKQPNEQTDNQDKETKEQPPKQPTEQPPKQPRLKKNIRNKESKSILTPPSLNEFIEYFKNNGFPEQLARKVFQGYHEADWHDSRGQPIKNWKQKVCHVWFTDTNKKNYSAGRTPDKYPGVIPGARSNKPQSVKDIIKNKTNDNKK